ncbi:MAG: lysophospholipid acyltransferase family protein [Bacteroidetes bacterium]|nr:lysophospholipid acyltransferase family protein [Bacteroidota bacterium]MBU1115971.1 lysophospholipid acyltransferase family protein [Bacteroidota bacterium]MBU1798432.1 lysophospholipid acyltransferase family protein [Bacteroidota bacterium]
MALLNKNKIEFALWKIFTKIVHTIGFHNIPKLAKSLAFIFYYFIPIRKSLVISNLKKAFPDKSGKEISKIAYKNYVSVGTTFMEIMAFQLMTKDEILTLADVNNIELAQEKIKNGKGVILLTAHISNWELGALFMGLVLDKQINVLVKKQRNKYVANWMSEVREKFTNKEVPLGVSVRELYKTLITGGVVGIVGDQRGKKEDGIIVNFFNIPTVTFQGFASLGIKNKVPILVVLGKRLNNGKYLIDVEEINYDNLPEKLSDQVRELNQRYMTLLENKIKKNPEQWLWMHNIWKY